MARIGTVLLLAAGLVALSRTSAAGPDEDLIRKRDNLVAVHSALQKGREQIAGGNYQAAVDVLEAQLEIIDGNKEYLLALRDAYLGLVQKLRQGGRADDARAALVYQRRLQRLDPGALLDLRDAPPPAPRQPAPQAPAVPEVKRPDALPAVDAGKKPPVTARGIREEDDPFSDANARPASPVKALLARADNEYLARHYDAAGRLYEQACHVDSAAVMGEFTERWAYCKIFAVNEALRRPDARPQELEREARLAQSMSPKMAALAEGLLQQIHQLDGGGGGGGAAEATVEVRHTPRAGNQRWAVAETANFRVFHNQSREVAEKAARIAEGARQAMARKWFGEDGGAWSPRCDLFLHATGQEYARETNQSPQCPGHSSVGPPDSERIAMRRIDIHVDDPNWPVGVLPHETTHVVLAGRFGPRSLPRWADEGMAVLSEPRDRIDLHLRNLPMHRRQQELFPVGQLMRLNDYPDRRLVGAFYAESVSLVDYLSRLKGPQTFTHFLRDALREGDYEAALRRHYGINGFRELEGAWMRQAFPDGQGVAVGQ
jgi:hypothetical protein